MKRLFIAIDLPDETKRQLVSLLPRDVPGLRATPVHQIHLTLHFLGEVENDRAIAIGDSLSNLSAPRLTIQFVGVGTFRQPRGMVWWVGVADNTALSALHQTIAGLIQPHGCIPDHRPYKPHLTIARADQRVRRDLAKQWVEERLNFSLPPLEISSVVLFSSILDRTGATHHVERNVPLALS